MAEPFIQVTGLRKAFQMGRETVHALAGVDVAIAPNTFSAIIGPSGSGKSTLLYLIGGLDRPSGGRITVAGQTLDDLDENELAQYRRRTVGFVFQSFNLVSSMTALENVMFPMRFRRASVQHRRERARELLRLVGLADRAQHRPTELSGGQQQRVAIARALVNEPQLILADEPTGNLDSASSVLVMQLLADLHRQGRTVLMVTHDPRLTRFATATVRILDGRVVSADEYEARANLILNESSPA
ncbi:MAG: ABC transporter ATP-binding protein [Anaerolineales bacterium]|nr:ABC transporter ATP-binding protein [Anaerolineales bacterium]